MPKQTNLEALAQRCEEKKIEEIQKQKETPPVPISLVEKVTRKKRKKRPRKVVPIAEDEIYSDGEDAYSLELTMAFREADQLKRQVSFWKAKCAELAPMSIEEFEIQESQLDCESEVDQEPAPKKLKKKESKKKLSSIKIAAAFDKLRAQILPPTFVFTPLAE